jgi:hypothetical protein
MIRGRSGALRVGRIRAMYSFGLFLVCRSYQFCLMFDEEIQEVRSGVTIRADR